MKIFGKNRQFDIGWTLVIIAMLGLGLYVAYDQGFLTGTPLQAPVEDFFGIDTDEDIMLGDDMVKYSVYVRHDTGSFAAEDIIVNVYDENGQWLDTGTASSGLATFNSQRQEGTYVWLQARQAEPTTADGYITPLMKYRLGNGDPTDTVSCYSVNTGQNILWVYDVASASKIIFNNFNDLGVDIVSGTAGNITTSDSYFKTTLFINETDTHYGGQDFTDMQTGIDYIGGIWFVWKGTASQNFEQGDARYFYSWSDPTYVYYAWNWDISLVDDSVNSVRDVVDFSKTISLTSGSTFTADGTVSIDCFDLYKVMGNVNFANFIDGGATGVTAETIYVTA